MSKQVGYDLSTITKRLYESFKGQDWPIYDEFITGYTNVDPHIKQELDKFVSVQEAEQQKMLKEHSIKFVPNIEWRTAHSPENAHDQDHDLEYNRQKSNLPSIKNNIDVVCNVPWNTISVDNFGRVFLCSCTAWLPYSVGHVTEFDTFDEIQNSTKTVAIQKTITNKKYNFCATHACGIESQTRSRTLETNSIRINLTVDVSCNLSCPSCRERVMIVSDETLVAQKIELAGSIKKWVDATDKNVIIEFGGGDIFASAAYKQMLSMFSDNNRVMFTIATNGLLLKKNCKIVEPIINRIFLSISIDAASKETYETIRRGGKWETLLENLDYIKELGVIPNANFVIQRGNFREIPAFVQLCNAYNMHPNFTLLEDWGTMANYADNCVHNRTNVHFAEFVGIVKDYNVNVRGLVL